MDGSHLLPTAAIQPHPRDSISEGHRGSLSHRHSKALDSSADRSHDGVHSTTGWGPTYSTVGNRLRKPRRTLVLCFDGTGNQFHGDTSDSNILKIFRMLDRSEGNSLHYYQPGIGTYVASAQLGAGGTYEKLKNWYVKAKDSAVGTSFADHVVGGYKFLMQYYSAGDNIYMFGFSRGSYTARFLAEMLDWVGLITHGNEEMIQFAWRTFSKWKAIDSNDLDAKRRQKKAYQFMVSFRETFSRPVRRIRFLGLFDTVNSVPRFENAMLSRKRVPFSAISSAKVIRHAVSIDERRAKFRADLVSHGIASKKDSNKPTGDQMEHNPHLHHDWIHRSSRYKNSKTKSSAFAKGPMGTAAPEVADQRKGRGRGEDGPASRYRSHSRAHSHHSRCSCASAVPGSHIDPDPASSVADEVDWDDDVSSDGDEDEQNIEELWFPGGHADIGGGWEVEDGEVPLSHIPLVWIVREAERSGLAFDQEKMEGLDCLDDRKSGARGTRLPTIEVSAAGGGNSLAAEPGNKSSFKNILFKTATEGKLHDCLRFGQGLPSGSVLRWKMMEWLPFRRLDLADDGKWKPIRWPLPRGEVRDMPPDAKVHISAIKRMERDPDYRPGNLILGGGGRGVIRAPKSAGIGLWDIVAEEGDLVGERVVRKPKEEGDNNGNAKTG